MLLCNAFVFFFFFQAEDGIRDAQESRGLGDVYKRQAWRLARQLAGEHRKAVTLWIDDPAPLARLVPGVDPAGDTELDGVRIRRGPDPAADWIPPDVVVETFGTGLPTRWIDAMARARRPPAWIVLEHLSAGPCLLYTSPSPR